VRAAADVALSELPAKAPEKAVMQAEGSGSQSGKVGGAKAKEKEKEENNGKSFSVRPSARPTANPWFNNLQANSRKREESRKKERQAKNEEKEREKAAKAAVDLLGGGKKQKKDADIPPVSAAATAVEAPILAGDPPEVPSPRKKQKISQSVKMKNDANVGDPNAALILSNGKSQSGRPRTRRFFSN
jgi:hypothetical protein